MPRTTLAGLLSAAVIPLPALAQTAPVPAPAVAPSTASKTVYAPADFARFAPRTAYDLLLQLPGFTLRGVDDSQRGLGQASENVLIDGRRVANKSGGAIAELQRTPVDRVEQVELVDASTLGIAGLAGLVANVRLEAAAKSGGQFEWSPEFRAHYAKPRLYSGSLSYSGDQGLLSYTLSLTNDSGRGAFGGPVILTRPDGTLVERRTDIYRGESEQPTAQGRFGFDLPGDSLANLTLSYAPYWRPSLRRDTRDRTDGNDFSRRLQTTVRGRVGEVNGDVEVPLGPGKLKLIANHRREKEPLVTQQTFSFASGAPDEVTRFFRDSKIRETIGRAEYGWKLGSNDFRITAERADNSLDQRQRFATLVDGAFVDDPERGDTGVVRERRYEALATWSRPLGRGLNLQLVGGGELSWLERVEGDLGPRKFFRPKGSATLGWQPGNGWDGSLKLERRVGQISFFDFLDQPRFSDERENSGNPLLVPPQSWILEGEVGRALGSWGKTRLRLYAHRISDIVDIIPIGPDGQGIGNLPRARRLGLESTSTLEFAPLGWRGAKLDMTLGFERTRVDDPLTGEPRPISGTRDRWASLTLRHDIPGSPIAWGMNADYSHYAKYFYLTEVFRSWEGPWWIGAFVEHKNILGLTVRADVGNLLNARHRLDRTVYLGRRDRAGIDFVQRANQLIGPIFSLSVRGNF